jgi:nucleoside-diphosphate-sugar epimerase
MPHTLIVGCGDVGTRLAKLLQGRGERVTGVRRHIGQLELDGIPAIAWDVGDLTATPKLPADVDQAVFLLTPDQRDIANYQATYLAAPNNVRVALQKNDCQIRHWVFGSSTAVYAENSGAWVDEAAPLTTELFNGVVLAQAERNIATFGNATAVRFAGLYGAGRETMIRLANASTPGKAHWTNRVNVLDAARALNHILALKPTEKHPAYNVVDNEPVRQDVLLAWLRKQLGVIRSTALDINFATGKRVSAFRLKESGFQFLYPSFREGYAEMLRTKETKQ